VGRGIRVINHPALTGRVGPGEQALDLIYHAELGLDEHVQTIYEENEMDPVLVGEATGGEDRPREEVEVPGVRGVSTAERPETFVLFERGALEQRIVHDVERIAQRKEEREREVLARNYAAYAASTDNPVPFEQYVEIIRSGFSG